MAAPKQIADLVNRFEMHYNEYKSLNYREADVRSEFIDPFFEALGWDVINRIGADENYKDVLRETREGSGAPDYAFRYGERIRFYVEAKKPFVNIDESIKSCYQLRNYAWNAKLPLSILTDFEDFAVYDCRYEPKPEDRPDIARILFISFHEYLERWDEIERIFSKKAILQGSFDKYVITTKGKKGTKEVDDKFLEDISKWRVQLANSLAFSNEDLSKEELNASVQATIDRIVFLRICEDRGIEKYGQIQGIAAGENIYAGLCDLFKHADNRYNSGLFHFKKELGRENPDVLALDLKIDDNVLKDITHSLYPPSPYNFAIIAPEILGQVYEQFLGKVIRLKEDRQTEVEDKPEVKKAGGIFYTPTYIVDFIIKNTVGKFLENKTPALVSELRILDPACGSGSFLLGAYKKHLTWHLDWYVEHLAPLMEANKPHTSAEIRKLLPFKEAADEAYLIKTNSGKKRKKVMKERMAAVSMPIYKAGDVWKLTLFERKRILLNNIYGVDIDAQAVEVTKLSLLLNVLEGESQQAIQTLSRYYERALPDLSNNIKCGNSLVEQDFFDAHSDMPFEELNRIKPFSWTERFPEVMQEGGFDIIIGNPPYVRVHRLTRYEKEYFWNHYNTFVAKSDLYVCFIEKGISLLRPNGILSFITPNTWTSLESFTKLRKFVLDNTAIEQLVRAPEKVFQNATVRTFIFVVRQKASNINGSEALVREIFENGATHDIRRIGQQDMKKSHLYNLLLYSEDTSQSLLAKCTKDGVTIGSSGFEFKYGFKTGDDELFLSHSRNTDLHRAYTRSANISRFGPLLPDGFVDYRPDAMRAHRKTARPGDLSRFERPKIVIARMGRDLIATFDDSGIFVKDAMLLLHPEDSKKHLMALIGLLNSKLLRFIYLNYFITIDVLKNALLSLPLPKLYYSDNLANLVERMLDIHKHLVDARISTERELFESQIEATDRQIDALVYDLYGLTEEDIRIVEGN
ncbi:MAG: N-6 DNA methylase [Methanothrix sp.]